jgi:predicted  nucleic acid-binding Zn-ribbon protein
MNDIEKRLKKLEKNSHPPVDWQELIYANIERLNRLEMDSHEFMDIIKHLVQEKKDLKKRLDMMEEILHSYLPVIDKESENGD